MAYYPAIPEIAKAFENDPRTRLALQMMQAGGSMSPTAGGKYGVWDGLARALQGVAGGYMQRQQNKHYKADEQDLMALYSHALGGNAPSAQPPEQAPAPQAQQLPPQMAPQAAPQAPPAPDPLAPLPDQPQAPPAAPQGFPAAPQIAAALGAPKPRYQGADLVQAMMPITAQTESHNHNFTPSGAPVTSAKGAKFAMQVMPKTSRDPGFGVTPVQAETPEEYNRVGQEYLGKLMERYNGDPQKAWGAYNWGYKRVDKAVAKHGDEWLSHAPKETRDYVAANTAALGTQGGDASQQYYAPDRTAEATPTGPVNYQTPEPQLPAMPERPAARAAPQSQRLQAGQELMRSKNPYAYSTALRFVEQGMGDQFSADREALDAERGLDREQYSAGLNNAYGAQGDQRRAAYDARTAERGEQFAFGREQRGYAHDTNERAATQGFQHTERVGTQQFQAGESALDRAATKENTQLSIQGRIETARERASSNFKNFMNTPQGARMYETVSQQTQQNDNLIGELNNFKGLNADTGTGGMILNDPTGAGSWAGTTLSSNLQQMQAITNKIAPLLRQAGSGSWSDKDQAMAIKSIPNIYNNKKANDARADTLIKFMQRNSDFQYARMQAASEGKQVEFMRDWSIYRDKVSVATGISFDQWKASLPQYNAQGARK